MHPIDAFGPPLAVAIGLVIGACCAVVVLRDLLAHRRPPIAPRGLAGLLSEPSAGGVGAGIDRPSERRPGPTPGWAACKGPIKGHAPYDWRAENP